MTIINLNQLPHVRGEYRKSFTLAPLTWFKVGGEADIFFKPKDEEDLSCFLAQLPLDIPITILGAGSNIIIRDAGIRGIVIKLGQVFSSIEFIKIDKLNLISVGSSTLNYNLSKFCLHNNIGGFEFLSGIPGTIGGGVSMNAGCYESDFKQIVHSVEGIDRSGKKQILLAKDLDFKYRECNVKQFLIFTKVNFFYYDDDQENISNNIKEISYKRQLTQPINQKTGGSTFRNPSSIKAWQLIENIGYRGYVLGGAAVSDLHCNFLINLGNATASDLENLGESIRAKVFDQTKINLVWEIKIIGKI